MEYLPLKQKYFKVNEEVANIYELLTKFKENISKIKDIEVNEAITLLNYILNLHGIFETNYNISTKFICIIRHNPNLKNGPKLYNVSVSERGEYIKENKK